MSALSGKRVVVTGAAGGLGQAFLARLASQGAIPVPVTRGAPLPGGFSVDLSREDAAEAVFAQATSSGPVHAFVSCAGLYLGAHANETSDERLRALVQVNALTPIALLKRFDAHFAAQGDGGSLVVTSMSALLPSPFHGAYGGSKALLHAYALAMALETGRVTVCVPGAMETKMLRGSPSYPKMSKSFLVRLSRSTPEQVARRALAAFSKGRPLVIPGLFNRLSAAFANTVPLSLSGRILKGLYVP